MTSTYARFGSFILFKEVFTDDLGRVWRAGEIAGTSIGRTVWLRVLDGAGIPAQQITASFATARMVGASIQSANLPSDPLFVEVRGVPALGCDYQPGQPLNRVLARARDEAFPVPPDNALLVVEKIALAVSAGMALEVGGVSLVHGFLHPGLIYLSNDGDATVTGFGIGEALLGALESPGAAVGGRAYLAPEALANRIPSKRADVYSLGAILFHLLTGTALPADPGDRSAALAAAHLAYDGEPLSAELVAVLSGALAPAPKDRFSSAAGFRTELEGLIYGGTYSPTTFNLALFMDRLFRSEIESDEILRAAELEAEVAPIPEPEVALAPEAVPAREEPGGRRRLWAAVAGAVVVAAVGGLAWLNWYPSSRLPPPEPTPTAAEIEARRQAQEERLKTMTQEMVQQMMAEREQEIRQELISRQTRIEELQRRLQESERRASKGATTSKDDASTRAALKREIEAEEEAQRIQEQKLAAEQTKILEEGTEQPAAATVPVAAGSGGGQTVEKVATTAAPVTPTPPPPTATPATAKPTSPTPVADVRPGAFVPPEQLDTLPVVLKSQVVSWPRVATRSMRSGVVIIQATVNASGGVDEVTVLRTDASGFGIPEAAMEAVREYRFKPGTKNGVAVTTYAVVTKRYNFGGR